MIDHALLRRLRTPIPLEGEPANIGALPQWMVALTLARRPDNAPGDTATWWVATLSEAGRAYLEVVEERDELRLALAAEQGKPEGAPSEGWSFETMCLRDFWTKTYEDGSVATVQGDGSWMRGAFGSGSPAARGKADHQRAAMIAADNAINPPSPK